MDKLSPKVDEIDIVDMSGVTPWTNQTEDVGEIIDQLTEKISGMTAVVAKDATRKSKNLNIWLKFADDNARHEFEKSFNKQIRMLNEREQAKERKRLSKLGY